MPAPESMGVVTGRRKEITLEVLAGVYPEWRQVKDIVALLNERDDWPEPPWRGPKQAYTVGTAQHLEQMLKKGVVERTGGGKGQITLWRLGEGALVKDAVEVLKLRGEGLSGIQIALRLGLQRTRVYTILNDPTGTKERERKRRYCPACGAPKRTSTDTCRHCVEKRANDLLPPDEFKTYIDQARHERGIELLFGVRPDLVRVVRIGTKRGYVEHEVPRHQTWQQAIEELELT